MWCGRSLPTFRKNFLPQLSWLDTLLP
jgi:hypothetical protein